MISFYPLTRRLLVATIALVAAGSIFGAEEQNRENGSAVPPNLDPQLGIPEPERNGDGQFVDLNENTDPAAAGSEARADASDESNQSGSSDSSESSLGVRPGPRVSRNDEQVAGTWVRDMSLNDLLQVLARRRGLQYFYNPRLAGVMVTGNLVADVPSLEDIKAMALQYDVLIDTNGSTLLAYTREQLDQLPKTDFVYSLKYLRPDRGFNPVIPLGGGVDDDATGVTSGAGLTGLPNPGENFKALLKPVLSASGVVSYEAKTNQLIISDNEYSIARAIDMLDKVDVPKKQVVVRVTILRIKAGAGKFTGVDWSGTLGRDGLTVGATAVGPIDQIFTNTPIFAGADAVVAAATSAAARAIGGGSADATSTAGGSSEGSTVVSQSGLLQGPAVPAGTNAGIILSPLEVKAVMRFLLENEVAKQEAGPAIITEDNEPAVFRVVERIPIIEQEVSQGSGDGPPVIATDVRYRIDQEDPIDPANAREVGVSIAVTPSILPDNTIRMDLLPRVATITQYTRVFLGVGDLFNEYPNVSETSASARARIPDGYTLVLGGYYQDETLTRSTKVPFFGDLPGLSFAFRSDSKEKVRSNIVFLITPTTYDPANVKQTVEFSELVKQQYIEQPGASSPDPEQWPGEDSESNFVQRLFNMMPWRRQEKKASDFPLDASNPVNVRRATIVTEQERNQSRLVETLDQRPRGRAE